MGDLLGSLVWGAKSGQYCVIGGESLHSRISHCEIAQEAWAILKTTYEGTKIIKSDKLQDEPFNEFCTKISDLRNFMVSLAKKISDAKLIKKILRSLLECFRIKVTIVILPCGICDYSAYRPFIYVIALQNFTYNFC